MYFFFTHSNLNALKTRDENHNCENCIVCFVAIWIIAQKVHCESTKELHFKISIVIIGPKCINQMGN